MSSGLSSSPDFAEFVGFLSQEITEFLLRTGMLSLFLNRYRLTNGDMERFPFLTEHLGRMAEGTRLPAHYTKEINPPRLRAMEEDRDHRHLKLVDNLDYGGLPLAVLQASALQGDGQHVP